jgi:FkbM family methyltransferase
MASTLNKVHRKLIKLLEPGASFSFSQSGEDLIVLGLFWLLGVEQPIYLDIGSNDPVILSNTYLFYRRGCSGVCVEPNPVLAALIKKKRPRDFVLAAGVGAGSAADAATSNFYLLTDHVMSTFSREEADRLVKSGTQKIEKVIEVPLWTTAKIIDTHLSRCPDLVSLDTEGLDYQILSAFDFSRFRPPVFCVETLSVTPGAGETKLVDTIDLMLARRYLVYADTHINTIFVDEDAWKKRKVQ